VGLDLGFLVIEEPVPKEPRLFLHRNSALTTVKCVELVEFLSLGMSLAAASRRMRIVVAGHGAAQDLGYLVDGYPETIRRADPGCVMAQPEPTLFNSDSAARGLRR